MFVPIKDEMRIPLEPGYCFLFESTSKAVARKLGS